MALLQSTATGLVALALVACGGFPWAEPERASQNYRLDLRPGVVAAFVEGLTPGMPGKVAYVTHVPSGTQAVLDLDGTVMDRHDGRAGGPDRLDALLGDEAAMARVTRGLRNGRDARPRPHTISWVPLVQFGGTRFVMEDNLPSHVPPRDGYRDLAAEDLGPELYRVAFRISGYTGAYYHAQDGDSTHLNPGTPVHAVRGYSPEFRLASLEEDGGVTLYEADANPLARTGEDLLDIRGKVLAIDILDDDRDLTVLATIDDGLVEEFVEALLAAPVDQLNRDHDGPRYFLGIRLADGTAVVRAFWLNTGELARGIMGSSDLASLVSGAVLGSPRTGGDGQ